jgi:hypothetical protein
VTDPDGGVDARCRRAPHRVARLIPAENDMYQFKGGARRKSASAIAIDGIAHKPHVLEGLAAGETLVYVAAADYGLKVAERVRTRLDQEHLRIQADQGGAGWNVCAPFTIVTRSSERPRPPACPSSQSLSHLSRPQICKNC